ncbi:zinc-dependent alcohol dehydrogenase [Evansella tamaricis]|uniref:Alcohol dehydrogenase catalytic domain-containing protein n=1 Tax=Evansella tamaricis TaxID=2069301 RepID=A0ABS6JDB0_9BACI|nr:alcohol dehydrogenase catalytic domain-containing protein [Evansella tamaricis]MBU9711636.1 alcohol dehydrogenase catalytic domain-containing protein [Evansella tamaricis]
MKSIIYEGPNLISIQEKDIPEVKEGWVLIKTSHVGICGTDLNIYAGAHPRAKAPLIMGHEFSGTIVKGHPTFSEGTPVTVNPLLTCGKCKPCLTGQSHVCETLHLVGIDCNGGMAEYVIAPIERIAPLPADTSLKLGALMEPVAVAVHAARQGEYIPGDHVVVYGAGTIGLCVAMTLKSYGATNIMVVEPNELRLKKAKELGFHCINPMIQDVHETVREMTNGTGSDFVFDCAGHPSVIQQATKVVKVRGRVVVLAAYKKPAEVNLLEGMFKELSMSFTRVYTNRDFEIAGELLNSAPEFERLITHVLPVEEAQKGFDLLTTPTDAIKVMYKF